MFCVISIYHPSGTIVFINVLLYLMGDILKLMIFKDKLRIYSLLTDNILVNADSSCTSVQSSILTLILMSLLLHIFIVMFLCCTDTYEHSLYEVNLLLLLIIYYTDKDSYESSLYKLNQLLGLTKNAKS